MLKAQDCIVLLKILANPKIEWTQRDLAAVLYLSLGEVNSGIKRLCGAGLLRKDGQNKIFPNIDAISEFLISSLKFFFPAKLGEYTRGIPTSIAAPMFHDKIALGNDPVPVWPDAIGEIRGVALAPIYPSITQSIREHPDNLFYELLVLIDVLRSGRARERNMAAAMLKERLKYAK